MVYIGRISEGDRSYKSGGAVYAYLSLYQKIRHHPQQPTSTLNPCPTPELIPKPNPITMIVRVRSRDGLERVTIPDPSTATVGTLKSLISTHLNVPVPAQTLSLNQTLLLAKTPEQTLAFTDLSDPAVPLSSLPIAHGTVLFLSYAGSRSVPGPQISPAGSFGRKMTMDDLIARQVRVSRQETPHLTAASFDRNAAQSFQLYINSTLAFAVKRGGFMYGRVDSDRTVYIDFIYEPPQVGDENSLTLLRNPDEEALVEAIAAGLGMRRVGFVFSQAVGRVKGEYTLSAQEVAQAAELHAEGGIEEWVTALVKLEVNEEGATDVHFEAFQLSDVCVKLFKDGWFVTEGAGEVDPKVSRLKKDVVIGVKDTREVDNDFFLVPVSISDHQGPLSSSFPVENRIGTSTQRALKDHLDRTKQLPFVKRISDFHLLLVLAQYLDAKSDVPRLAECVLKQSAVPEGYQLLIESLAAAS